MKPTRNKVFCLDCERTKMLFKTEQKAKNFIRFNSEAIEAESGYSPNRAYFCMFCNGWHVTSSKEINGISRKERMLLEATKPKEENKLNQAELLSALETELMGKEVFEQRNLVSVKITALQHDIKLYEKAEHCDRVKLKELRQWLEALYLVRRKYGFFYSSEKYEQAREHVVNEWRLWAEKLGYNTSSSLDSGD